MEKDLEKLYGAVSSKFDIGDIDSFKSKMKTPEERKNFYDAVSAKGFSLGDYGQYEDRLKKKEESNSIAPVQGTASVSATGSLDSKKHKEGTLSWNQAKLKEYNPEVTAVYDQFTSTKQVSDESKQEIEKSVDDEINQSGFWNNVVTLGKKGYNSFVDNTLRFSGLPSSKRSELSDKLKVETNPIASELKEVESQIQQEQSLAKQENKPIPTYTEEEKFDRARTLKIDKEIKNQSDSQTRSFLKELQSDHKDNLSLFQTGELASFSEDQKLNLEKQNILRLEVDNLQVRAKELVSEAKENPPTEEKIQEFKDIQDRYKSVLSEAISVNEDYVTTSDEIGDAKDNLDVFKRNYGWIRNFSDNAGATALDLTAGLVDSANWFASATGTGSKEGERQLRGFSKLLTDTSSDVREGIAKPLQVEEINSMGDLGQWFMNTAIASQVPIYAAIATGTGGIAALGLSATGTQYEEMRQEELSGEADYSYAQKSLVPLGYGASETVSAMVDRMIMLNAGKVIKAATEPERKLIAQGMWKGALQGGKEIAKGGVYEGVDESATEIMQNVLDKFVLGKNEVGIFDNVKDAAAAGIAMGLLLPAGARVVSSAIKPFSLDNNIQKANQDILKLEKALDNMELSPTNRVIIESQLDKAKVKNNTLLEQKVKGIENLSNAEFEAIKDIERTQSTLRNQATEIESDSSLTQELKDQITSSLKEEFNEVEQRRKGILQGDANAKLSVLPQDEIIRLKDQAGRELMEELNPDGTKTIHLDDAQISERALDNYQNEQTAPTENEEESGGITFEMDETNEGANEIIEYKGIPYKKGKHGDITTLEGHLVPLDLIDEIKKDGIVKNSSNETAPREVVTVDESIRPGVDEMGEVRNESENQTTEEIVSEGVPTTDNTETVREPKVNTLKTSENGVNYAVSYENGVLTFKDKNGNTPSRPTVRALQKEYAKTIDFTEGTEADLTTSDEGVTANAHIAANSQNASQIAEAIALTSREEYQSDLDYKQRMIAENLSGVSRESFIEHGDSNYITQSIAMQYFGKKGESTPLDVLAKEISEIAGIEVTEQDIVDFIVDNPRGKKDFLERDMKADLNALKTAFTDVTGLPATNEFLNEAQNQKKNKDEYLNTHASSLEFMDDEYFVNLENEISESYGQESTKKTSDVSRENSTNTQDSTKNEGGSRVRETSTERHSGSETKSGSEGGIIDFTESKSIINILSSLFDKVKSTKSGTFKEILGTLSESGKKRLSEISGLSFKDITTIEVNQSDLRHIYNDHFGENEKDKGQNIPLTNEDIYLIPEVLRNPDSIDFLGYDEKTQSNKFQFTKDNGNGTLTLVEVYGNKGGKLSLKTFYNKKKKGISQRPDVLASGFTSENDFGASPSSNANIQNKVNLSKDLKLDDFIKGLDRAIDNLDQFGKENLGMNLPLVVARQALMAMKLATQGAKSVADIVSAGLNAVQQTDWYKNLSQTDKLDLDANFVDYLNKPFETNKNTKSRDRIEKEIKKELQNGKTESEILDSYSNRMEKMMAKDYFERSKPVDKAAAKTKVDKAFEESDRKMEELTKPKFDINKLFRTFVTKFFDRQFLPKFMLNKAGGRLVRDYIITAKGASGYAKFMYDQAYNQIYKGLSSEQIKVLDKVIQLRRFIAIDENRRANDLPAVVHPDHINENIAQSYLDSLKDELGDKAFNDLMKRADSYFDTFKGLLDEMHDSGIISKESRDRFFDIDYQPREFLEFLENSETETAHLDNGTTGGLGKEQIQRLEKGLDTALVTDSQYLLSRALNVRAKTIAMNNTTRKLAEFMKKQVEVVEQLKTKQNPTKKEKDIIKYFGELQKRVKENPLIGFTETGNPIYKSKKTPNGYADAYYWVDGMKHNLFMEQEFHDQYFDALNRIFSNPDYREKAAMFSGTGLVKSIATGNNPTFFLTNTPRDFFFISTFSEEYGRNVLLNMAKLTKDAALGIRDIKKENDSFKNFVKYGGMTDFLMDQGKFKGTGFTKDLLSKVDNKTRERFSTFFNAVTLQKMQMYSEVGFRMGVFRRSIANQLKEMGLKDISQVTDKRVVDDIYTTAASSARSTMDFNQGGTLTKDLDAFIPYLNAASQGTRVMFDNFRDRPIETTLRVVQSTALLAPIPIGLSLLFLGASDREEDEKELGSVELYNKALKGVSSYDRNQYFIIFNGNRNKKGEFEYYRMAKPQQLTPFFTLAEGTLQKVMRESVGDKETGTMIEDLNWIFQNNISPVEFGITDNAARNPLLKSALSVSTGYDFFREQDISSQRGKVPVAAEGFESASVEEFYKKIGETLGWSPARMKAAVESIITTPSTSPYVGMVYGGMDAMFSDKDTQQVMRKFATDMGKSTVKRVVKETSDFNRRIGNKKKIKEAVEKIDINRLKTKFEFNSLVADLKEGKITKQEINAEIKKIAEKEPFEARRISKRVNDQLQNRDTPSFVFEIKYANSAKERAVLLVDKFGDALKDVSKMEDKDRKLFGMLRKNSAVNTETMSEYMKLVE